MKAILIENEVMRFNGNLGELKQFMFEVSGGRLCNFNVTIETAYGNLPPDLRYINQYSPLDRLPNNPCMNIYHIEYSVYRNINDIIPGYYLKHMYYDYSFRLSIRSEHKLNLILGDVLVWTGMEFTIFDKARIIIDNKKNIKNE